MTPQEPARRIDLDGLQVFDAVMRERSVTRAAARLALSQPAVSHALARLRRVFDDPLFVKTPGGVRPTRRAEELWHEVQQPLTALRHAVAPEGFDPGTGAFSVSLAVNDMIFQQLLIPWYARLCKLARGAKLSIVTRTYGDTETRLAQGTLDFGLGLFASLPPSLRRCTARVDTYVCAFRQGNPIAALPWNEETFRSAAHVRVSPNGDRFHLADVGLRVASPDIDIALVVSHFSSLPKLLGSTDLVALMPRFYAEASAPQHGLEVRELPFPSEPATYELVWHERAEMSPALMWFRGTLLDALRTP